MATVLIDEQCVIPAGIATLADFRRWAVSPEFPPSGRIDWVASRIEVDVSPEDIFTHGTLKSEIVGRLWALTKDRPMHLFTSETRVSNPAADLSVEPDVAIVTDASVDAGRVRLVPGSSGKPDRFIELEGSPDLVIEIVSDSSVVKDTRRLPAAYHKAGVAEFWLVDARGPEIIFTIHRRGSSGFMEDRSDTGLARSALLGCCFSLTRSRNPQGRPLYDLKAHPEA
jgi:Uma2 family endonuclease